MHWFPFLVVAALLFVTGCSGDRISDDDDIAGDDDIPAKPAHQAFELCLAELGVAADRAAFVGDDWRMDIGGARDAGLHPIWIRHRLVERNWPDVEDGVPVIESLEPLLQLDSLLAAGKPT